MMLSGFQMESANFSGFHIQTNHNGWCAIMNFEMLILKSSWIISACITCLLELTIN